MRQKVAISCAFLHEPRVIVFDEPLTGLDPRAIRTLKDQIRQRASAGAAIIISSHLLSLVEDICSHLLILSKGRCKFFGPLDELRSAFGELSGDASLEEVFFHATDGTESSEDGRDALA
jgi:ABC-2 type transport system ATP-binding protein